jgi:hypothetical protein
MGRYYSGDIEGKFWFGVQDSTDASFFGGLKEEPQVIEYIFCEDDLPEVTERLKECKNELGIYKDKLDKFFNDNDGYTDEELARLLNIDIDKVKHYLEWYARFMLGEQIESKLKDTGECQFTAEL